MDAWSFRFRVSLWLWWWRLEAAAFLAAYFFVMWLALAVYSAVFIALLFIPCRLLLALVEKVYPFAASALSLHVLSFVATLWLAKRVLRAARDRYHEIAPEEDRDAAIREELRGVCHVEAPPLEEPLEPDAPPPVPRDSDLFIMLAAGIVKGFKDRRERASVLWKLGADAIVPVLFLLARSEGRVTFRQLAEHWPDVADLERVVLGLSAIRGVFLILSNEPKGMALMPRLRVRLLKAGGAHLRRETTAS